MCRDLKLSLFISYIISFVDLVITRVHLNPQTHDQLLTSVASQLSWLERRTGITRSQIQIPFKS